MSVDDRLRRAASEFEAELRQVRIPEPPVLGGGGFRMAGWLLVAVALVAVAWMLRGAGPDVAVDPPPSDWIDVSSPVAQGRVFPSVLAAGPEVVVWGGGRAEDQSRWLATGAALDVAGLRWSEIPAGPLSAREAHVAVWTGDEMVVCCGDIEGPGAAAGAYDPADGSWRVIASPPISSSFAEALWTGGEIIVFGGVTHRGLRPNMRAAAYDPATDTWRDLADMPYPTERRGSSVWAGGRVYAWPAPQGVGDDALPPLAYDPVTDIWHPLAVPADTPIPESPSLVWTGSELLAWGVDRTGKGSVGIRYRPDSDTWLPLPPAPLPSGVPFDGTLGSQAAVWTGKEMLVWAGWIGASFDDEATRVLGFDPATDTWLVHDSAPVPVTGLYADSMVWSDGRLVVYTATTTLVYTHADRHRPGPETAAFTVPIHLTGDGLIFAREHQLGETAQRSPTPLEIVALSGARVTVELPRDFQVGAVGRHAGLRSPGRFVVGWAAYARGEGLWAFADLAAELVDVVELNGGLLAFYDAGQVEGTRFFTLWQGDLFDLVSGYFDSVEEAADFLATMDIEETPAGPVIAKPGWEIHDEDLVVTVFVPGDSGRGDAILDIRPVTSDRATFAGPGVQGRWGEFLLVGDGIEGGIIFRSTTAWASLTPGGVPRIDSLSEASLYDRFNVVWNDR